MTLLFLYGTLKRGGEAHSLLQNARFRGLARLHGHVLHDAGDYPAMIAGEGTVSGEVWEVSDLAPLDAWEDHPRLFARTPVVLEDGTRAETYLATTAVRLGDKIDRWDP